MKIKDHAGQTAMDLAKILNRSEIALLFLNERLIDASQWRSGEIQCLINEGADVHARDGGGRVSLHYAADLNRLDAIKILLKNGAKVDEVVFTVDETKKHENGRTALHFASMEAHLPAMLLLLEHGANIQAATEEHHLTALHFAARWTPEVVSVLLDRGALVNGLKESSISPLHFAVVGREQRKVIDLLVKSGADVNARVIRQLDFAFMKRNTPLHVAIEHDCSEAVEALLAHGADMSIRNHEGKTALALAKTRERNEIVAILEGHRKLARKNLQRPSNTGSPNPT